jgi:hypothetical protein
MPVGISSLPQLRSHQLNRSRLNVAHTIATFPTTAEVCCGRFLCIPKQFRTTQAMLPRVDQRKISIGLFRLTHHRFGSAMRASFQVTDNKKA